MRSHKTTPMIDYGLIKNFLAIDIIIHPVGKVIYWMDTTPNLSLTIPVPDGYKIIEKNLRPDRAIAVAMELRKQGFDVVLFPSKT